MNLFKIKWQTFVLFQIVTAVIISVLFNLAVFVKPASAAQNGQILFILDASSSMLAKDGGSTSRIDKAKSALNKTLDSLPADVEVGVRVYGSTVVDTDKANGCKDTQILAAPASSNISKIKNQVSAVKAKGWTLMGEALKQSQNDFKGEGPKTIVLLSDGIDTCSPPDACEVAKSLTANGVKVKINTFGLLVDSSAKKQLSCIADGGNGSYFDIYNLNNLESTLSTISKKEVELFKTQGQAVDCSLRMDNAPILTEGKLYKDEFTTPQEVYCAIRVKAHQKVTFSLKGIGDANKLGVADYLQAYGFKAKSGDSLVYSAGDSADFKGYVASVSYEFDTDRESLKDGDIVAFRISIDNKNKTNINIPIEFSYSTEGGSSDSSTTKSSNTSSKEGPTTLTTVLLTLLGVGLILVIALIIYKLHTKNKSKNIENNIINPNLNSSISAMTPNPNQQDNYNNPPKNDVL